MELSEAKEILKKDCDFYKVIGDTDITAIETLLNYIENESIPKEKVKELSNEAFEVHTREYGSLYVVPDDSLQELLGE